VNPRAIEPHRSLTMHLTVTKTGFDMDPFVVTSLGRKVCRTRVIRHNLNPVYNEKIVLQVMRHEQAYTINFSVVDRDKLSGNDFVASTNLSVQKLIESAPEEDPETGLYRLYDPPEYSPPPPKENKPRFRLPLSRSSSSSSITKLARGASTPKDTPALFLSPSMTDLRADTQPLLQAPTSAPYDGLTLRHTMSAPEHDQQEGDPDMIAYKIPLELKNKERWEAKHNPELYIKAKYLPYRALRQQFWRVMLKQYDADDSKRVSKVELQTMLDTLGSTLREETIDSFFERFKDENESSDTFDLTFDQAVICLEDQLQRTAQKRTLADKIKELTIYAEPRSEPNEEDSSQTLPEWEEFSGSGFGDSTLEQEQRLAIPIIRQDTIGTPGEEGKQLYADDLADEGGEEHVIEIRECTFCHQPLKHRTDADVITHIATCASSDWRQVNNLVMGGFVTASQAQRKWYSKVITKIGYGGYKLGANSANILVQDRLTGQINEERMSVYVRLGIRLLYKAMGSREMEKKRSKYGLAF
jgi:phosphatidylserine decarboxylase